MRRFLTVSAERQLDRLAGQPDEYRRVVGTAVRVVPRRWDGTIVVWAHTDGKASLFDGRGRLVPAAQRLLDRHAAIAAADLFLTGEFPLPGQRTPRRALRRIITRTCRSPVSSTATTAACSRTGCTTC